MTEVNNALLEHLIKTLERAQNSIETQRKDTNEMHREFRVIVDKLRDGHSTQMSALQGQMAGIASSLSEQLNEIRIAMTEKNADRTIEHRMLAVRVTAYAAGVTLVGGALGTLVMTWIQSRFFS